MSDISPSQLPFHFKQAWVTLLTRTSYLPGAILLAYSLHKQNSTYPLLILITPSFPASLLPTLTKECKHTNAFILPIDSLSPPPENTPSSLIAARFQDTWTKLRVFELYRYGFSKMVFLDADMLILKNMDGLFDIHLPARDWIAANHACVCNLDGDAWAPGNWRRENCAYTGLGPESAPRPVPEVLDVVDEDGGVALETHSLLNSGMFIFTPFQEQWDEILHFLNTDGRVRGFLFPDQDFLARFFRGRWMSLGWEVNALKTWRYWHKEMWRDEEVRNLHFIVDKPWSSRVGSDEKAGYLGKDGTTHGWWWREFERWELAREECGEVGILEMVRAEVARPLGEEKESRSVHGNWQAVL